MPTLIVIDCRTREEKVYALEQDQVTIGRHPDCDIALVDNAISRRHAEIVYDRHDYYLVDLESGNGTRLNGKTLHPNERYLLRTHDTILIEPFELHFLERGANEPEANHFDDEVTDTDIIEIKMIQKMLGALKSENFPSLQVITGEWEGRKIFLTSEQSEYAIGRDEDVALSIPDASVSRRHALISRKWGGMAIADLNSKNGTYVNGERVREKLLSDGDQVTVGSVKLLYRNPSDVSLSAIRRDYKREWEQAPETAKAQEDAPLSAASPNETVEEAKPAPAAHPAPEDALDDLAENPKTSDTERQKKPEEKGKEAPSPAKEAAPPAGESPWDDTPRPKLRNLWSTLFIGLGILVSLLALAAIISILMNN